MKAGSVALISMAIGLAAGSLLTGLTVAYHYETRVPDTPREQRIVEANERCDKFQSAINDINTWQIAARTCFALSARMEAR
jgi:hypothetical protein